MTTNWPAELEAYERTFDEEPPVEEKLAALDALAEPASYRWSKVDVSLAVVAAIGTVAWYAVVFLWP
jgi:hypothetical protein